eukprot:6124937-Prymnesium_polylepis.1
MVAADATVRAAHSRQIRPRAARRRVLEANALASRCADVVQPYGAITEISALRGGKAPVDTFSIMNDELADLILGDGVFKVHAETNGAAVKMVPPLDFFLRAKRDPTSSELKVVKEMAVKGHVAALVPNHADPGAPMFRVDVTSFAYPEANIAAYKTGTANKLVATPGAPAELRAWGLAVQNGTA